MEGEGRPELEEGVGSQRHSKGVAGFGSGLSQTLCESDQAPGRCERDPGPSAHDSHRESRESGESRAPRSASAGSTVTRPAAE